MEALDVIKTRIDSVLPMLDERQRRIYLATEARSLGWVNVGISSDTAVSAVSTISDWWENEGKILYNEKRLPWRMELYHYRKFDIAIH